MLHIEMFPLLIKIYFRGATQIVVVLIRFLFALNKPMPHNLLTTVTLIHTQ